MPTLFSAAFYASISIAVLSALLYVLNLASPALTTHPRGRVAGRGGRSALVLGATGATGRQVVRELLASNEWSAVTTIGRRPYVAEKGGAADKRLHFIMVKDLADDDAVRAAVLSFMRGEGSLTTAAKGTPFYGRIAPFDVLFNCIGTTRKQAGGAVGFVNVEVGVTRTVTNLAADMGVLHVSVVSAQGANHKQWAVDWFHPLLYVRTLGEKEQATLHPEIRAASEGAGELQFPHEEGTSTHGGDASSSGSGSHASSIVRRSIFRPGMLNRLSGDRFVENVINRLGLGLRVDVLARAMVRDAEAEPPVERGVEVEAPVFYEGNTIIAQASRL